MGNLLKVLFHATFIALFAGCATIGGRSIPTGMDFTPDREDCEFRSFQGGSLRFPLHWEICQNHVSALELLLLSGAALQTMDYKGSTPLTLAVEKGNAEAVRLLLVHGADPNGSDGNDLTPLITAAAGPAADGDFRVRFGRKLPGYDERMRKFDKILQLLLDYGALVNLPLPNGATALDFAHDNKRESAIKLLVRNGARRGTIGAFE